MPNIVQENLWKLVDLPALYVVTTNSTIKGANGALVMGRGAALELKERVLGIDLECGDVIRDFAHEHRHKNYGFQVVRAPSWKEGEPWKVGIGIFQVKHHFKDKADPGLIATSVMGLTEYARKYPQVNVRLNFPGIGAGRLKREDVEPLLEALPNNVTICYK
jgi:hypothetical protein